MCVKWFEWCVEQQQAYVTSLRQASQHKTQSPIDPTDTSQVVRMRTRPSRSRQALEMHTEAVKGKTSLLLRYLLQYYTTYILLRVQGRGVGYGIGYEVIRVMGHYMRFTCTKHAVYQGVKQGCDICAQVPRASARSSNTADLRKRRFLVSRDGNSETTPWVSVKQPLHLV